MHACIRMAHGSMLCVHVCMCLGGCTQTAALLLMHGSQRIALKCRLVDKRADHAVRG